MLPAPHPPGSHRMSRLVVHVVVLYFFRFNEPATIIQTPYAMRPLRSLLRLPFAQPSSPVAFPLCRTPKALPWVLHPVQQQGLAEGAYHVRPRTSSCERSPRQRVIKDDEGLCRRVLWYSPHNAQEATNVATGRPCVSHSFAWLSFVGSMTLRLANRPWRCRRGMR